MSEQTPIAGGVVSYFAGQKCGSGGQNGSGSAIYAYNGYIQMVKGCIYTTYSSVGGPGFLGFPLTDEVSVAGGVASYFTGQKCAGGGPYNSGSAVYASNGYIQEVHGCIYAKYSSMCDSSGNCGPGYLGFPLTNQVNVTGGSASYFAGQKCGNGGPNGSGSAVYAGGGYIQEIQGCIYTLYSGPFGGPAGVLGLPVSDEEGITASTGTNGRVNYFAGGNCGNVGPNGSNSAIYWTGVAGYEVGGCIYAKYIEAGGPYGGLGFPVSNEYTNASGNRESDFETGYIEFVNGQAVVHNGCKVSSTVTTC